MRQGNRNNLYGQVEDNVKTDILEELSYYIKKENIFKSGEKRPHDSLEEEANDIQENLEKNSQKTPTKIIYDEELEQK